MKKHSSDQKIEKCKQEIYKVLDEFGCRIIATPKIKVLGNGNLNVANTIKIVPTIQHMIKPKTSKYVN